MRLFHVSEESDIEIFIPRIPTRSDLNNSVGVVWAITESCLPNFLTPRDCRRVTYHIGRKTIKDDIVKYISSNTITHVLVLENIWFERMKNTTLYLYEFDTEDFELQDEIAGYYISKKQQIPIAKYKLENLFFKLFKRNVELRFVDNLWDLNFKPFAEFASKVKHFGSNAWITFIFQNIYYIFESLLMYLLIAFGQEFGEKFWNSSKIPWGGILLGLSWGLMHIFTQNMLFLL